MTPMARANKPVRLRRDNLAELPAEVKMPRYRPDALKPGIVHIGLGSFHRAHQPGLSTS